MFFSTYTSSEIHVLVHSIIAKVALKTKNQTKSSTMVSSTYKTDLHDITEILLKVALNIVTLTLFSLW
jgi:hypothetical protein